VPWICAYPAIDAEDADCGGSEAVMADGRIIGTVSSGAYGRWAGQSLTFATIAPEFAAAGTKLEVMILGQPRPAQVVAEAVYDARTERPRS
jgi:dimethylglycine dehydrogenase